MTSAGAVQPRLDVELARGRDEHADGAGIDQRQDALAHQHAGLVQILADIGEALVAAAGGRVGVVREHRDAGGQRAGGRLVEGVRVDDRHRDGRGLRGDGGVHGVDHLGHVGGRRAGPLMIAAEQRAGVGDAVLGRHEERVGRHVIDEHELPARMLGERPGAGGGGTGGAGHQPGGGRGGQHGGHRGTLQQGAARGRQRCGFVSRLGHLFPPLPRCRDGPVRCAILVPQLFV